MLDRIFTAELWDEWLSVFDELYGMRVPVSAPFVGYRPDGFPGAAKSVLYVGKATEGPFGLDGFLEARKEPERAFLKCSELCRHIFEKKVSSIRSGPSFWGFASEVARAAGGTNAENLSWSNLVRIGVHEGPPEGRPVERQAPLARKTLQREIEELRPDLIVFVNGNYAKSTMLPAIGSPAEGEWYKSENVGSVQDVWWQPRNAGMPAVIWMRHPQGAESDKRSFAIQKMVELIS